MPNENANFTPSFKGYSGQYPFKFWCQTVLPIVYDDSLSYYELLNKVVNYLNNVINDVSNMESNLQGLLTAYTQLQNYVNSYFDNLDVQQEINTKLDEMVTDGTFDEIINEQVFGEFNNRIETVENSITNLANTKVGKNDENYVTMDMLTQEVKTAMTGGSVAVVGAGAVGTVNIQNDAVIPSKIVNSALPVMLNAYPNNTITIDETNHTITLSSNFLFCCGGRTVTVTGSPTVSYSATGTYWITVNPDNLSSVQLETTRTITNYILGRVVNGVFAFISDVNVVYTDRLALNQRGTIENLRLSGELEINFITSKVMIPRTYNLILSVYGKPVTINTTDNTSTDYQEDLDFTESSNFTCIAFDTVTRKLTLVRSDTPFSDRYIPVGFLNKLNHEATCTLAYRVTSRSRIVPNPMGYIGDVRILDRIIFDFENEKIVMPRDNNIVLSVYGRYVSVNTTDNTVNTYQNDLNISDDFNCLGFDIKAKKFDIYDSASSTTITGNVIPIAFFNKLNNKVVSIYPYSVISKKDTLDASVFEIAVFGDSITAGAGSQHPYVDIVNSLSGYRLLNYGIGESGYAWNATTDSQHLVGQGVPKRGVYQEVPETTNIKYRVQSYLQEQDTADVIFLFGGSNDVGHDVSAEDFTQAVSDSIESVINAGKAVGVIGILRRNLSTSAQLQKLVEFNNILKQQAEYYGVPFLDLSDNGMNPVYAANRQKYFYDNVHPNDAGHVKLSYKIIDFVKKYFCYKNEV